MHRAPWTKTSSSRSHPSWKARIWSTDSSRGSTTRETPRPAAKRAASGLEMVIWVEAWSSSSGQTRAARSATAGSCTMSASTPLAPTRRRISSTSGSSASNTNVFSVR